MPDQKSLVIRAQEPCAESRRRCSESERMIVQLLWTVQVSCGTPPKTGPKQRVNPSNPSLRFWGYQRESAKSAARSLRQEQMRSGPATQTAFVRGFLLAWSPRGGGMTASARQRFTIDRNQ